MLIGEADIDDIKLSAHHADNENVTLEVTKFLTKAYLCCEITLNKSFLKMILVHVLCPELPPVNLHDKFTYEERLLPEWSIFEITTYAGIENEPYEQRPVRFAYFNSPKWNLGFSMYWFPLSTIKMLLEWLLCS